MSLPFNGVTDPLYLPLASHVEKEAQHEISVCMHHLSTARQLHDYERGHHYQRRLFTLFEQHYHFTVTQRQELIQELLKWTFLHLEPFQECRSLDFLSSLLKDRASASVVTIEWREQLEAARPYLWPSGRGLTYAMKVQISRHKTFTSAIRLMRRYFKDEALKEIADEFLPFVQPFDVRTYDALAVFAIFAPSHSKGLAPHWAKLLPHYHQFFAKVHEQPSEALLHVALYARVAKHQADSISFLPYLPDVFQAMLISLRLPIRGDQPWVQNNEGRTSLVHVPAALAPDALARELAQLVVYSLHHKPQDGQRSALSLLAQFLHLVSTYYHPSNSGAWSKPLATLLSSLALHYAKRKGRENLKEAGYDKNFYLDPQDNSFVSILLPVALRALFNKTPEMVVAATRWIHQIAAFHPSLVLPAFVQHVYPALEDVNTPHRMLSVMQSLCSVCPILFHRRLYPQGATHLENLLWACLPGIDPIDAFKTMLTLSWLHVAFLNIPLFDARKTDGLSKSRIDRRDRPYPAVHENISAAFKDVSVDSAVEQEDSFDEAPSMDLNDEDTEDLARSVTFRFEEWALAFVDALVQYMASVDKFEKDDPMDSQMVQIFSRVISSFFNALSIDIYCVCLKKIASLILSAHYPVAKKYWGVLVRSLAFAHPELSLPALLEPILSRVVSKDALSSSLATSELLWYLYLAARTVHQAAGANSTRHVLLPYTSRVVRAYMVAFQHSEKEVRKASSKLLRSFVQALCEVYPVEYHPFDTSQWSDVEQWKHYNCWSSYQPVKERRNEVIDPATQWHVPSEEELQAVEKILNEQLVQPLEIIDGFLLGTSSTTILEVSSSSGKEEQSGKGDGPLERALYSIFSLLRGVQSVLGDAEVDATSTKSKDEQEQEVTRCPLVLPSYTRYIRPVNSVLPALSSHASIRASVQSLSHMIASRLQSQVGSTAAGAPSLRALMLSLKLVDLSLFCCGIDQQKVQTRLYNEQMAGEMLREHRSGFKVTARPLLVHISYYTYLLRMHERVVRAQPCSSLVRQLIKLTHSFLSNSFAKVRSRAVQMARDAILYYPPVIGPSIEALAHLLRDDSSAEADGIQGALAALDEASISTMVTRKWSRLIPITDAYLHMSIRDNDKVELIAQRFFRNIYPSLYALRLAIPLIENNTASSNLTASQINNRNVSITRYNRKMQDNYEHFICSLLQTAQNIALHWRYQLSAAALLFALLRPDAISAGLFEQVVLYFTTALYSTSAPLRQIAGETMLHLFGMHIHATDQALRATIDESKRKPPADTLPNSVASAGSSLTRSGALLSTTSLVTESEWFNVRFYDYAYSGWREEQDAIATYYVEADHPDRYVSFKTRTDPFASLRGSTLHTRWVWFSPYLIAQIKEHVVAHLSGIVDSLVHHHPSLAATVEGAQRMHGATGAGEFIADSVSSHLNGPVWPVSGLIASVHAFDTNHVTLMRGLVETVPSLLEGDDAPLIVELRRLISHENEQEYQVTAAEIVGGILAALKHASLSRQLIIQKAITPLLVQALAQAVPDAMEYWILALRRGYTNVDPRRMAWLTRLLTQTAFSAIPSDSLTDRTEIQSDIPVSFEGQSSLAASKRLQCLTPVLDIGFRVSEYSAWLMDRLWNDGWLHTSAPQLRGRVVRILLGCIFNLYRLDQSALYVVPHAAFSRFLTRMNQSIESALRKSGEGETVLTEDTISIEDISFLSTSTTLFIGLNQVTECNAVSAIYLTLLPLICRVQYVRSERNAQDLVVSAKGAMRIAPWRSLQGVSISVDENGVVSQRSELSRSAVIDQTFSMMVSLLNDSRSSFHVRASAINYLAVVVPRHSLLLTCGQVKVIEEALVLRLSDLQVEVREAAGRTLAALLSSCLSHPSSAVIGFSSTLHVSAHVRQIQKRLLKMASTKIKKDSNAVTLAQRHGGVLGLLALVTCHPYDLPPHLPTVLHELSAHVNDPAPISTVVKKGFADFMRTHKDEWEMFSAKFNESQLEAVNSVQSAPSYFA